MTEFTKTKIHFVLALLGTLFVLHTFVEEYGDNGFLYLGVSLKIMYVYALVAGLFAFSVYCYALALMSERPHSWAEMAGNSSYAVALVVPPLYGGLYLATLLAARVGQSHWAWAAPMVALTLGVGWLMMSQLLAWLLRKRLGEQDQTAKIDQLENQEITSLNKARDLFDQEHYDLSVIEAWKAIEARLRRILLQYKIAGRLDDPQAMIKAATRAKLLHEPALGLLQELRRQWNIAVSTEPLSKQAADTALAAARNILATIPVGQSPRKAEHVL